MLVSAEEKENSQVLEDSEDDEDYISGNSDLEEEDDQDNIHDDDFVFASDDKTDYKDSSSSRSVPVSPRPTAVKFAANVPNPILRNPDSTNNPKMVQNKTRDDTGRNVTTCDVVNIPGNPKRVLIQIVENQELTRFLKIQFCCNAGPMKDVAHNFKVTPHSDGKGCDVDIPISADFFLERNATLLGYGHEADGNVRGPIKHMSTLRSKFQSEDDIYNVVETYNVSFGPVKVKKRVIDPKVKTIDIYCATFIFYFEIDEEKATRKQKIILDSDEANIPGRPNSTNPNNIHHPPFASPTASQGNYSHHHSSAAGGQSNPAAATTSASYFSSPNAAYFTSPPPPVPQNHHATFSATHIHASNPHFTARNNYQSHHFNNAGNNHAAGTTTADATPVFLPPPPPPGVTIDPSLIVEYLKNLNFAAAGHQQPPQSVQHQNMSVATAAAGQNTGRESNYHAHTADPQVFHQNRSPSTLGGTKFKRGDSHVDVCASREEFGHQRMLTRGRRSNDIIVETVVSEEAAEENFLSPAAYSQISTEVRDNGFFPAEFDDDL